MSREQWRPVVGFEGLYEVSDLGKVRSVQRTIKVNGDQQSTKTIHTRLLAVKVNRQTGRKYKRLQVTLCANGKQHTKNVARLVAEAFIPNPRNLPCVLHLNDDACNNTAENLEWGTLAENSRQAAERCRSRYGQEHHAAVLSDVQRRQAYLMLLDNEPVSRVARRFGVSRQVIEDLKNGKLKGYKEIKVDRLVLRGSSVKRAKLCEEQVLEIKRLLAAGVKQRQIAKQFNVANSTIASINRGASWAWLTLHEKTE